MKPRIDFYEAAPDSANAMVALEKHLHSRGLEQSLTHLVRTRASQLNGCAYCIDMHTQEARAHGETEQRLYVLAAWHESPAFTARERAALAWTEAITLISTSHASDEVYAEVREYFGEKELVELTLLIGSINVWNRLAIGFRSVHAVPAAALATA